jgi:uncharacterized SAM-binding protein YcdF (DUF218 family)
VDKRRKAFIFVVVAHWLLSVMAIFARFRNRKRVARSEGITYAPMFERNSGSI